MDSKEQQGLKEMFIEGKRQLLRGRGIQSGLLRTPLHRGSFIKQHHEMATTWVKPVINHCDCKISHLGNSGEVGHVAVYTWKEHRDF